jgi:hypothetical protein
LQTYFCPKCSGEIEFADDAAETAHGRCRYCTVTISLGDLRRLEWRNGLDERIRAIDWSALEHGGDPRDADFRWTFAFQLGQLASDPGRALMPVERALFRDGRPLAIARAARPFLLEIVQRLEGESKAQVARLLERVDAAS